MTVVATVRAPLQTFRIPGYRWVWGNMLCAVASWVLEVMVLGWLVLDLTGSAVWVGAVAGLRGVGMLGGGLIGGMLADRWGRRTLMLTVQGGMALLALGLAVLSWRDALQVVHVALAAVLLGMASAISASARTALIYDLVGSSGMLNAVALVNLGASLLRVVVPAGGGVLLAQGGPASVFLAIAGSYTVGVSLLVGVRAVARQQAGSLGWRVLGQSLRTVWGDGNVRALLSLSMLNEALGYSYIYMLPVLTREVFQMGPEALGVLTASFGVGSVAGNGVLAVLGNYPRKGVLVTLGTVGFGGFLTGFALTPWFGVAVVMLALAGAWSVVYDAALQTLLLTHAPSTLRGRTAGLLVSTWGLSPVGGVLTGAIASVVGASWAVAVGGLVVVANALRLVPQVPKWER
ncbi:MAG: MFS transporter [Dehalococcoidia bacterium]|nr:MFS transporter [Dehalococcoidia bacterium]MDW8120165.1 MFS transporter [Chloroflexota bacterium]